jgi:hypothetical protein
MTDKDKQHIGELARVMTLMCVRNTRLEDIHAGKYPTSRTGDYTDVKVVDAEGREIPWPEISHISDPEMRELMKQVVNRIYTFFLKASDPTFQFWVDRWTAVAMRWDVPELDDTFMQMIEPQAPTDVRND